jgi:hypothetical protein
MPALYEAPAGGSSYTAPIAIILIMAFNPSEAAFKANFTSSSTFLEGAFETYFLRVFI